MCKTIFLIKIVYLMEHFSVNSPQEGDLPPNGLNSIPTSPQGGSILGKFDVGYFFNPFHVADFFLYLLKTENL